VIVVACCECVRIRNTKYEIRRILRDEVRCGNEEDRWRGDVVGRGGVHGAAHSVMDELVMRK